MFTQQAVRASIVALAFTALTAAPSVARPEGAPATPSLQRDAASISDHGGAATSSARRHGIPPRTEGMGVQPRHVPYAATRPTPSVTHQALLKTDTDNSVDWPSIMLGALGVLAALVAALIARSLLHRHRTTHAA
jgi:hypothetical protein